MAAHGMHQIGAVASAVNLSLRTVRYYEEVGLVVPSGRTEGGFRLYTDDDIDRLALVRRLKPLDFSLDEVRNLLAVRDRLAGDDLGDAERADLAARLAGYAEVARQRCEYLRDQLASVEAVTDTLEREATERRGAVAASDGER